MAERLTRYELGIIQKIHDTQHYTCAGPEYVAQQLKRIGLPPNTSRFEVAEKVREIERDLQK